MQAAAGVLACTEQAVLEEYAGYFITGYSSDQVCRFPQVLSLGLLGAPSSRAVSAPPFAWRLSHQAFPDCCTFLASLQGFGPLMSVMGANIAEFLQVREKGEGWGLKGS